MEPIVPHEYGGEADMYICGACQVQQAIFWNSGERVAVEAAEAQLEDK